MLKALFGGPIALIPGDDSEEHGNLLLHEHMTVICEQTFASSPVAEGSKCLLWHAQNLKAASRVLAQ